MQRAQNMDIPCSITAVRRSRIKYSHGRWQTVLLLALALLMLSGCTRNRPTPEAVDNAADATEPVGVESTPVAPQVDVNNPAGAQAEPQVEVVTPVTAQGENAEPEVAIEQPTPAEAAANENPAVEVEPTPIPTLPPPDAFAYTVTAGDSVPAIAELFGVTPEVIRELNFLTTDNIQPGQILRIPRQPGDAPTTAETTSESGPYSHVVQPGDTLNDISLQYDVSAAEIIAANNLSAPDNILVGQALIIPGYQPGEGEATGSVEENGQVFYIVQPGDQLFAIAERFGVATADIISANGIQNPGLLRIGQRLIIPGITELQAAAASGRLHTVQPGEGLGQIAAYYGVTIADIARLNNLGNVEIIYPGQELIIPGQ
ncbi:MAG: LysM peptidoglycan-binding domain-containing protein [Caldilineaceae bacterium]